jgi:hypothetical protein
MMNPMDNPFTKNLRNTMSKQASQAFELNKKAVAWQLEQLQNADKVMREQSANAMKMSIDAWKTSTEMMLDMQQKGLDAMTPAETDAD